MWFLNRLRHSRCLLSIMGTWKEAGDNKKVVGPILTELSKSLDCNLSLSTHRKITCRWTVFSYLKIDTVIPPKPKAGKNVQYVLQPLRGNLSGAPRPTLRPLLSLLEHGSPSFTNYANHTTPYVLDDNSNRTVTQFN